MEFVNRNSQWLERLSYMNLVYILLMPIGVYNDWAINEQSGDAIFNLLLSTIIFIIVLRLGTLTSISRVLAILFLGILFLFSLGGGLFVFADSSLEYGLFLFHTIFAGIGLYTLIIDDESKLKFQ